MLTPKQEVFVQGIIKGLSQADAYREAYNADKMSDNAIYREASLLVANPKVAQRLNELREQLVSPKIMTAQKRLEWLTEVITDDKERTENRLKAADIMNKMQGEYIQKVVADVDATVNINIELTDE
jgi:phage terminase small subunit